MCGDLAEPRDTGVSEWWVLIETARNGAGDECSPPLRQQPEHSILLSHQCIQPHDLAIKIRGNGALLRQRGNAYSVISDESFWHTLLPSSARHSCFPTLSEVGIHRQIVEEPSVKLRSGRENV